MLGHLSAIFEYLNSYHDFGHGGHGLGAILWYYGKGFHSDFSVISWNLIKSF